MIVVLKIEVILYIIFRVCDQLAVAAAIDPRYVVQKSLHFATVELSGRFTRGQMVVDYGKKIVGKTPNVYLIDRVDIELFKKIMLWSLDDPTVDYAPPTEWRLSSKKSNFSNIFG